MSHSNNLNDLSFQCICGVKLAPSTVTILRANDVLPPTGVIFCDGCFRKVDLTETIYGCRMRNPTHPNGYDLCKECVTNNDIAPSNASMKTLQKMGYKFSTSYTALKAAKGDLKTALFFLKRVKIKTDNMNNNNDNQNDINYFNPTDADNDLNVDDNVYKTMYEYEQNKTSILQNKMQKIAIEMNALLKYKQMYETEQAKNAKLQKNIRVLHDQNNVVLSLKKELATAKIEINKLLDDKKEMELLIINLNKENKRLKAKKIDISKYMQWNHQQVLNWILSLENGYFNKYTNNLNKELTDCDFKGSDLVSLTTKDIRDLGIKTFYDAKKLGQYIQQVLIQQNDNNLSMEGQYPTPIIYHHSQLK